MANIHRIQDVAILCDDPVRIVRIGALRALNTIVSRHSRFYAEQIWKESSNVPDQFGAAMLLIDLGDPSRYEVILGILKEPENSMFTQAVRSVPKFARYHIVDENGEDVDWVLALAGLLHRDDLKSTSKMAIATALQQIGTKKAVALIGDASEK